MWNPFKKEPKKNPDGTPKLSFMQKIAMKRLEKMSEEEKQKMVEDAFKPENRKKLIKSLEQLEKSGMASKSQIRKAKERLGIYE